MTNENTYKNRHAEKHNKKHTYDQFPYSLPCERWMSVEDVLNEFKKIQKEKVLEQN